MTIVKINGKYYEEVEAVNERQNLRNEIDRINTDVIPSIKEQLSTYKTRLEDAIIERDALKAKLDELNK